MSPQEQSVDSHLKNPLKYFPSSACSSQRNSKKWFLKCGFSRALIFFVHPYTGKPLLGENYPKCIPIVPFTAQSMYRGKMRSRTQFPLRLCWTMTIHKSQGLTIDRAVIDIGKSDIGIGMTYVALSRLKTIDGLFLKYKPYDRYQKINDSTMLRLRQIAENELRKFQI